MGEGDSGREREKERERKKERERAMRRSGYEKEWKQKGRKMASVYGVENDRK